MNEKKVCKTCGACKLVYEFGKTTSGKKADGTRKSIWASRCKSCINESERLARSRGQPSRSGPRAIYNEKTKGKFIERAMLWRKANPDRYKDACRKYRESEKGKNVAKNNAKARTERLADCYVRRLLVDSGDILFSSDISQQLVEAKRQQLKLQRLINERKSK